MNTTIDLSKYMRSELDETSQRGASGKILFLNEYLPWLDDCSSLIDLGCGAGNLVQDLRKTGRKVDGVTYNADEIAMGQRHGVTDLIHADLHSLPIEDDAYDGGIMWDVLEHTLAPMIVLSEAARVIKHKLLVFIPGEYWQHCSYHMICLTPSQMTHIAVRAGWQKINIATHYGLTQFNGIQQPLFLDNNVYQLTKEPVK